jgi:hypothetical protein
MAARIIHAMRKAVMALTAITASANTAMAYGPDWDEIGGDGPLTIWVVLAVAAAAGFLFWQNRQELEKVREQYPFVFKPRD